MTILSAIVKDNKIERYLESREDVVFAFLYGSQERYPIEYKSENDYGNEDEIWGDLERLI